MTAGRKLLIAVLLHQSTEQFYSELWLHKSFPVVLLRAIILDNVLRFFFQTVVYSHIWVF